MPECCIEQTPYQCLDIYVEEIKELLVRERSPSAGRRPGLGQTTDDAGHDRAVRASLKLLEFDCQHFDVHVTVEELHDARQFIWNGVCYEH